MCFLEVVDYLLVYHGRSRNSPDRDKPPAPSLLRPGRNRPSPCHRVFVYLLAPRVIRAFMDAGLLYEDAQYHNCVFVCGRDGSGQPRFASKWGTCNLGGSSFKRDVLGSDKKIGFRLPCAPEIEEIAVFEATIVLVSFCTLYRLMSTATPSPSAGCTAAFWTLTFGTFPPERHQVPAGQ